MNYKIGDLVTRISHKHDILFRIVDINPEVVFLKGVDVRLYADAPIKDLMKSSVTSSSDLDIIKENVSKMRLDRSTYFYIPGSVLHIDGDNEYLDRCMNFYKEMNIKAMLLDLNMPKVDGFAVLEYMKKNDLFDKIPVSIISGDSSRETIQKAFTYPIVDMLEKPFNEQTIRTVLQKTLWSKELN